MKKLQKHNKTDPLENILIIINIDNGPQSTKTTQDHHTVCKEQDNSQTKGEENNYPKYV